MDHCETKWFCGLAFWPVEKQIAPFWAPLVERMRRCATNAPANVVTCPRDTFVTVLVTAERVIGAELLTVPTTVSARL